MKQKRIEKDALRLTCVTVNNDSLLFCTLGAKKRETQTQTHPQTHTHTHIHTQRERERERITQRCIAL